METEKQTHKNRIDPLLKSLGWNVVPFDANCPLVRLSNCAVEEYETGNGPADHVSTGEDIKKLDIPIHAFDVIIADECHRVYSNGETFRLAQTLDQF